MCGLFGREYVHDVNKIFRFRYGFTREDIRVYEVSEILESVVVSPFLE